MKDQEPSSDRSMGSNGAGYNLQQQSTQPQQPAQDSMGGDKKDLQEKPGGIFDQQKKRLLSGIDVISSVLQNTTDGLRKSENPGMLADYTEKFGGNVADFKKWVSDLNVETAMESTRAFAKRRPDVILLGMFGVGLLAGRFLKSAKSSVSEPTSTNQVKGYPVNAEVH